MLERLRLLEDIEQMTLTVIAGNAAAKKLYEGFGFQLYGTEYNAVKWRGKYFAEDLMMLMV